MKFKLTGWTVRIDDKHLTIDTHANGTIDFNVDTFEEFFSWSFTVEQLRSLADQAEALQRPLEERAACK